MHIKLHLLYPTWKPHTNKPYLLYMHTRYTSPVIVWETCQSVGETDPTTLNWLIIQPNKNSQQRESTSILKPLKLGATSVNLQTLLGNSILLKLDKEKQMDRPSLSMIWHAAWSKKKKTREWEKKQQKTTWGERKKPVASFVWTDKGGAWEKAAGSLESHDKRPCGDGLSGLSACHLSKWTAPGGSLTGGAAAGLKNSDGRN